MEGSTLGKLIFYTALMIFLFYWIHAVATGQYGVVDNLENILRYRP